MTKPTEFRSFAFSELSNQELYQLLRLRAKAFVVEQVCPYLDLDNLDQEATHVLGFDQDEVVACARILKSKEGPILGRIVVADQARGRGLGREILAFAMTARHPEPGQAYLMHAQAHLESFYALSGFEREGSVFLEDGIPHIKMRRQIA